MAFFKKLRDRMFKSSSKLEEGLEAIVDDGGEIDADGAEPAGDIPDAAPQPAPPPRRRHRRPHPPQPRRPNKSRDC